MLELYEWPPVRSQRAKWVLEELELDYAPKLVDLQSGEQNSDPYRAIHPLGVVPAIKTDTYTLFESVAIVLQLIDENPDAGLAPALGTPGRAKYYQWSIFSCAELDPAVMMYFDNTMKPVESRRPPGTPHDPILADRGRNDFRDRADVLSDVLWDNDYLLSSGFSGADILIGHSCFMAALMGLLDDFPVLTAYYNRLRKRPAFQRAYDS